MLFLRARERKKERERVWISSCLKKFTAPYNSPDGSILPFGMQEVAFITMARVFLSAVHLSTDTKQSLIQVKMTLERQMLTG